MQNALGEEYVVNVGETTTLPVLTSRVKMVALECTWLHFFPLHIVHQSLLLALMTRKKLLRSDFVYIMRWYFPFSHEAIFI